MAATGVGIQPCEGKHPVRDNTLPSTACSLCADACQEQPHQNTLPVQLCRAVLVPSGQWSDVDV